MIGTTDGRNGARDGRRRADRAVWTRVNGIQGTALDLLNARIGHRHYAPHTHDEYAIGVLVDGREIIRYRGERRYATVGTILVIEPGEAHTGGPADPDGIAYVCLYPRTELLSSVSGPEPGSFPPHFRDPVIEDRRLGEALRLAHRALCLGDDPLEGESRLLGVLGAIVGRYASPPRPVHAAPGRRRHDCVRVAREVATRLADELTDPPALAEVAAELGLSRYQLLRAFSDAMGMPPYAWLAQHRVARARRLLDAGYRPAEAATLVGFADQPHLTRWFRRVLGVTPGAYRNSVQDGVRRFPAS